MATLSASLALMNETPAHVETLHFPDQQEHPFCSLEIKSGYDKSLTVLTDNPRLLESIASEARDLAAWLRNEQAKVLACCDNGEPML